MLPPVLRAHMFRKGVVHNPAGKGGEYQRCLMLCRKSSHQAAEEIIRLSKESEDERVRYMAAVWVYEHAWGKPKDFDPKSEEAETKQKFDPSAYTPEQLDQIERAFKIMVEVQGSRSRYQQRSVT